MYCGTLGYALTTAFNFSLRRDVSLWSKALFPTISKNVLSQFTNSIGFISSTIHAPSQKSREIFSIFLSFPDFVIFCDAEVDILYLYRERGRDDLIHRNTFADIIFCNFRILFFLQLDNLVNREQSCLSWPVANFPLTTLSLENGRILQINIRLLMQPQN